MVGGVDQLLVVAWKGWGIQVMVLLSFTMQVTLLLLAGIRRHNDSTILKFIIWSAYMLADTIALFALGHMSLVTRSPEQQLLALWASLLLVHLGGQDNITAYAIEDNKLWLRHLQTFGLQILATTYVLYVFSILGSRTWLRPATILMFVTGILKYGERVWALMCASNSASSSLSATSYKDPHNVKHQQLTLEGHRNKKDLLFLAYTLLDVPKKLFEGPTRYVKISRDYRFEGSEMVHVVRMQLLMMYDLLYTKAAVVHTWYGRCIRVITLPATVVALLLFHGSSHKDVYRRVDVVVTYVLLGGAVVLETTSVLRAMFSKWTYAFLLEKKCVSLSHVVRCGIHICDLPFFCGEHTSDFRGYMGQHCFLYLCDCNRNVPGSKIAKWMGREDWWDSMVYSWSTPVPQIIIQKVVELVSTTKTSQFDITNSRGRNALRRHSSVGGAITFLDLEWSVEFQDLDESILVWHIATHVFLYWCKKGYKIMPEQRDLFCAINAVSNYMFFLLAVRPYMLPYPVSRQRYVRLCYDVITYVKYTSTEDLLGAILDHPSSNVNSTFDRGSQLAARLISKCEGEDGKRLLSGTLEVISEVWVEMLCYTAYSCNESSHAKHLSSGGEIMTTISLLMIYMSSGHIKENKRSLAPDTYAADASPIVGSHTAMFN